MTSPAAPFGPPVDARFHLTALLGSGTYGEAFRATDARTDEPVVVKLLHARYAQHEKATERFRREIVALEVLRHPHVVSLVAHGVCPEHQRPYYAMAWVEGTTLGSVLEAERRLPLARALRLTDQLLQALEAAHEVGVLHRDLKPENLLIERPGAPDEHLRVIDFGLAKHLQGGARTLEDLTGKSAVGTPVYMAPEQCSGLPVGAPVDLYAVGCVLMELLTGRPPFESQGTAVELITQHVLAEPPRLDERLPDAPAALVDLVAACLEKAPENRPSARDLRRALAGLLGDPIGGSTPTGALGQQRSTDELDGAPTGGFAPTPSRAAPSRRLGNTAAVTGSLAGHGPAPVSAPAPLPPVRLEPGGVLGSYLLEQLLGEGGFGAVFRTRLPDGRPAAVKALLPVPDDPVFQRRARFERELRLLEALRHPAIPALIQSGEDRGVLWAVIELIEGEDLGQTLARRGRLLLPEVMAVLRQVLPALDAAHMRGVVHCDLKPENIRLRTDGRAFLLDFGIAKLRDGSGLGGRSVMSLEGSVVGTFEYLPPELARGRKAVSPMADVYSMGCVIYHLLGGRPPFEGETAVEILKQHVHEAPAALRSLAPEVPVQVEAVVHAALAKKPAERPMTAGLLLRALEEAVLDVGVGAPAPGDVYGGTLPTGALEHGSVGTGALDAGSSLSGALSAPPLTPTAAVAPPGVRGAASTLPPDYVFTPPTSRFGPASRREPPAGASAPAPAPSPREARRPPEPAAANARPDRVAGPRADAPKPTPSSPAVQRAPVPLSQPRRQAPVAPLAVGLLNGPRAGTQVRLDPTQAIWTIGRDPSCEVALSPELQDVSRRHTVLRRAEHGLEVVDPGSAGGTTVEGVRVGPDPLPLARGAVITLGSPDAPVLLVVDDPARLEAGPPDLVLRRDEVSAPRLRLDVPHVLGRGPQATPLLDPERDLQASALHCRIAPRLNQVVVEDLGTPNGTWIDGRRVQAAVLRPGAFLSLGGTQGVGVARLKVEPARRPRTSAVLGRSREPVAATGDAPRAKFDVRIGDQAGRLFLFAGPRLRFGRNRAREDGTRENDLLLRAFPRHPREAVSLVKERTGNISGHHGSFLLTKDGVAVRDASRLGTRLDGKLLPKGEVVPLGESFVLEVADAVGLRGRVYRADVDLDGHPVAAVRLERTRDGEHHTYVWIVREVSIGSGPEEAIGLPAELGKGLETRILPGHARLISRGDQFVLTPTREDGRVEVGGFGPVGAGVQVALRDGVDVQLGDLVLAFSTVTDDEMIPPRA